MKKDKDYSSTEGETRAQARQRKKEEEDDDDLRWDSSCPRFCASPCCLSVSLRIIRVTPDVRLSPSPLVLCVHADLFDLVLVLPW